MADPTNNVPHGTPEGMTLPNVPGNTNVPKDPTPPADPGKGAADPGTAPTAPATVEPPAAAAPGPEVTVTATGDEKAGFTYDQTGNASMDMVLTFLGKNGYGPEHPAILAAKGGDFAMLKADMASKGIQGSDAYIQLGEQTYGSMRKEAEDRRAKDVAAVEKVVGGADAWKAVQEWATANVTDEGERNAVVAMLGRGGKEMEIAASYLSGRFKEATGNVPVETKGAGPAVAGVRGDAGGTGNALSPAAYAEAVREARNKHNSREGSFENSKAYASLRDRRLAYRG